MTDLNAITWRLNAYAGHWLTDDDLTAVTDWMADNQLDRVTAQHPVTVSHGQITYGQDRSPSTVRAAHRDIVTVTAPLLTVPPVVWQPDCDESAMAQLRKVFDEHEWSAGFGGVCVDCSRIAVDETGRVWCHRDDAARWPCSAVRDALAEADIPVPGEEFTPRVLGDCLDPDDNARAFAEVTR
jgi:hypothetical protein